jgi:predicted RND superfamily exporter protein
MDGDRWQDEREGMALKEEGPDKEEPVDDLSRQVGAFALKHSTLVIALTSLVTLALLYPMFYMAPTETASDHPEAKVFDIRAEMETKLPPSLHGVFFIVEAKDGDVLTQRELWELYQNEESLRQSDLGREYLYTRYDPWSGRTTSGIYTIADAVQAFFVSQPQLGMTLENASDEMVKLAIHQIIADPESSGLADFFSSKSSHENGTVQGEAIVVWRSPALGFLVNINNSRLPQEVTPGLAAGTAGGPEHQRFNRDLQDILRGEEDSIEIWGVAIDLTLESEEEGVLSIPLIIIALGVILVIVYLHFRSGRIALLTLVGLGMLIIWLKGLSNLVGLESSLTLDIIVPIAILVLGVDYAIHSIHRYREEQEKGVDPGTALKNGIGGVGGALFLAMLSTVVAFLSNVSSDVEYIVEFGIAAAMAIVSAFILFGLFAPTVLMRWDSRRLRKDPDALKMGGKGPERGTKKEGSGERRPILVRTVEGFVKWKAVVLPGVLVISILSLYFAAQLEAQMDAKDFLSQSSDFVISLDKLDEHMGQSGGEPAYVMVRGDMSDHRTLTAIREMIGNMEDDDTVARRATDGSPLVEANVFAFLEAVLASDAAQERIEATRPGVEITDDDGDGLPDSRDQLDAIYDYIVRLGIPFNNTTLLYEPSQIRESLFHDPSGTEEDITVIVTYIPGTREQAVVKESERELSNDIKALDVESISFFGLAGPGFERDVTLDATSDALTSSIIIAGILCVIILVFALRSIKYAIVTIIPVLLVAAWLYAFMYLAGFSLNAVTATIAAISIGVGIDYSVHLTVRFRQEMERSGIRSVALERATMGTGQALFGAAMSTTLGFLVVVFAPMPMFSSFGFLTALMILMAFAASLLVLPSILMVIERDRAEEE